MRARRLVPVDVELRAPPPKDRPWMSRREVRGAFEPGQWVRLVDPAGKPCGFGYWDEGEICVRILKRGPNPPSIAWLRSLIDEAASERAELRRTTDAYRLIHGANDGMPGVTFDVYSGTGVLETASKGAETLGRFAASAAAEKLRLANVLWKRRGVLRGRPPGVVTVREPGLEWKVDPQAGQKTGAFLDLRGLRRRLLETDLRGQAVLNLFGYTGVLGLAAERAGASEVWNVEAAAPAIEFGRAHHGPGHRWIQADAFEWTPPREFDLVICDPPSTARTRAQAAGAIASYDRLYRRLARAVRPGGRLAACCCTSQIGRDEFRRCLGRALSGFAIEADLPPEPDHPVRFRGGDYLKVIILRRRTKAHVSDCWYNDRARG